MSDRETAAFEFDRVTVVRAGRRILDEVTASIPAAGITVVSGPSGADKLLAERFARGEIDEEEYRRRVAVLQGEGRHADGQARPPAETSAR